MRIEKQKPRTKNKNKYKISRGLSYIGLLPADGVKRHLAFEI
jgi:hypothetical protein